MNLKGLFVESKLMAGVVVLVLARCVDRVLNTPFNKEAAEDITPEMKAFPHYKYAIMAFLDMTNSFMSALPTPHIGGNLANVLNQVTLPFNMLLSVIVLGTQYHRAHMMGAILVLYGAFVCMIPLFRGEVALNSPDPSFGWILLYVLAMLPAAASNVYKEIGLKDVDLDIWYANAWVSSYQLLWGGLTFWTIQMQAFSDPPVVLSDFSAYLASAHECFFGHNVTFNGVSSPCDGGIFVVYLQYILFNVLYNTLMMFVFKEGSSVLFVISSAVCLPLTDVLYMLPVLAGPLAKQKFTIFDGFALFIIVMGLIVYHSEREERGKEHESKSPMYTSPSLQRMKLNIENKRSGRPKMSRMRSMAEKRRPATNSPSTTMSAISPVESEEHYAELTGADKITVIEELVQAKTS
ncbi:hypothetical protein DYB38_013486 [Aphanomyces astaci]|uniref:EamA domain-containing protein n=1 Tax=Aphanomyces astaci TaxID=112090 RepID=A0A397DX45_APHAT|nr:hypothetical protein DYB38_013486 [Aphanomyces astaci]